MLWDKGEDLKRRGGLSRCEAGTQLGAAVKLHLTVSESWEFLLHNSLDVVFPTLASDIYIFV